MTNRAHDRSAGHSLVGNPTTSMKLKCAVSAIILVFCFAGRAAAGPLETLGTLKCQQPAPNGQVELAISQAAKGNAVMTAALHAANVLLDVTGKPDEKAVYKAVYQAALMAARKMPRSALTQETLIGPGARIIRGDTPEGTARDVTDQILNPGAWRRNMFYPDAPPASPWYEGDYRLSGLELLGRAGHACGRE